MYFCEPLNWYQVVHTVVTAIHIAVKWEVTNLVTPVKMVLQISLDDTIVFVDWQRHRLAVL